MVLSTSFMYPFVLLFFFSLSLIRFMNFINVYVQDPIRSASFVWIHNLWHRWALPVFLRQLPQFMFSVQCFLVFTSLFYFDCDSVLLCLIFFLMVLTCVPLLVRANCARPPFVCRQLVLFNGLSHRLQAQLSKLWPSGFIRFCPATYLEW